ncbi:Threonine dehydrogenase [Fulvivirga imtechensis AK7]|uniref:Threonine dehydrogenase n=1 Tax=Fulvivirga imtechensis AK7 TaxID=1237149 RepID=L8JLK6_9BACT|nr:zinc-binding dehydrogenase [Fulvivirga imtechensis]ELR69133.1 Threonine dehydrogenase [Fulvivirga imtechensis AK7]
MNKTEFTSSELETPVIDPYRAAVISSPGSVEFVQKQIPQPREGEVLVRLEGVGLCASNIPVWEGREWFNYPMEPGVPGHEGWGRVEETGPGVELTPGQRVAMLAGNVFAEYATLPAEDCILIPPALENVPFPGEPFGCMMNILRRADIQKGQTVAIIGLGFLGLGLVQLAKEKGARVLALSRRDSSLKLAGRYADQCIKMNDHWQIIEVVRELTAGNGCERIIECTGKQWPLDLAAELIADYGKLIIAGYHQDGLRKVNMQQWNWKAIDVINAHERDQKKYKEGIKAAIDSVNQGRLNPKDFLTHEFTFEQLEEAFEILKKCPEGFIKGYVKF